MQGRVAGAPISESRCGAPATPLFVGDDLAGLSDVLLDDLDFVGPGTSGFVGVGNTGGVLAFGLGEMVEEDVEVLLEGGAGHRESVSLMGRG